jgi:hypothetical protein
MSNRVDFFQSEEASLAVPGTSVSVLVDGSLCPYLEVAEIVRGAWPEFSWARLVYNPAGYSQGELLSAEDIEAEAGMGKSVRIEQVYNGLAPGASSFSFAIFVGQIEEIETRIDKEGEFVEIIVRDFSSQLKRVTVYGQRIRSSDGSSVFLSGVDTTFSADGKANAAIELIERNGKTYTAFAAEPSKGKLWSYAEVIEYLLREYLPDGQLQLPSIEQFRALTDNQTARDFDVTGLDLLEALRRCCERTGLRFEFVPRFVSTGPEQAIVFYRSGTGRVVELNCQKAGERFSISKTNISTLHSRKNFFPVTHRYIGQGDFKIYEATFELVKAWDPADESTDYDTFSPTTNPDFYKVKDVYRKWVLNEAGDYSDPPYGRGDAFDFSKISESSNFVQRRRRFWPALTTDKQDKSLGYFLEASFDNGLNWWQYLYAFNNLLDECGVWLSSDSLDIDTWVAALKGVLKFRITASVISDERLSCVVADGPVNSVIPVVDHIVTLPRQFKYRKVSSGSIFANSLDESIGTPSEIDDTTALYEFLRKKAGSASEIIETVDVQTPYLVFDYRVGDEVTCSPESRDLLSCRNDSRSVNRITRVQMDFRNQCTNLKIVRRRKVEV